MIHLERLDHVAVIRVDRPERLNCFDYPTLVELKELVATVRREPDIRVVLFTGTGKAFSAGADLKERVTLNETEVRRNVEMIRDVFADIARLPQPTIAAVNGHALGGGFEWMLACDFRIIVNGALVGLTETSFGIIPGAGGTQRLPRLIGETRAKEMIFTAKKIDAETAEQLRHRLACRSDRRRIDGSLSGFCRRDAAQRTDCHPAGETGNRPRA